MAHRLRQEDLPSGEAYLQRLKTQVFANDRTRYNFVLNRVQVWADIGSKTHLDKDALKLSVLQVIASLPNNTALIRDLNCLLPSQVAVFCPPSPAGKYVAVVTEDSGDIVELPISYDASSGECKFKVVFSSDDLRAAIPNNIEWNHVVQASIADGWTTSLLDLLTRQIEDASDDAEFRRLAFRRQTNLAKDHGLVPGHLLLREVSSEREEVGPGTTIKSFAQRYRGKMGAISVCLRVPARIPDDDFGVEGEKDRQYARNVLREVLTWYRLKHPNVLPLWGTHDNVFGDKRWSLVVPWMDNDDLLKYVKEHPHDMEFKLQAIYDIIEGLVYLHGQKPPIVHESLKARYILLDRNRRCRISHFACASLLADRGATITGTSGGDQSRWRAPEIRKAALDKARNKRAVDIFAFGCVVSEIYTGNKPFDAWSDSDIINKPHLHPYLPPTVPFKIERWTRKCWNERPEDRPTAMKLKEEIIPKDLQLTEASESLPLKFPSTLLDWVQSESMDFEFEPIRELDLEGLKNLVTTQDEADGVGMRVRKIVAAERAKIKEWEREQEHEHEHEQARQAAE